MTYIAIHKGYNVLISLILSVPLLLCIIMINFSPDCKKIQIAKAAKAQEAQGMKARHEMH